MKKKVIAGISAILVITGVYTAFYMLNRNKDVETVVVSETTKSALNTLNRAKSDMVAFLQIYDDTSYKQARGRLNCSKEVLSKYFHMDEYSPSKECVTKPVVTFRHFGVSLEENGSEKISYFAVADLVSTNLDGKATFSCYSVKFTYEGDKLVKIETNRG